MGQMGQMLVWGSAEAAEGRGSRTRGWEVALGLLSVTGGEWAWLMDPGKGGIKVCLRRLLRLAQRWALSPMLEVDAAGHSKQSHFQLRNIWPGSLTFLKFIGSDLLLPTSETVRCNPELYFSQQLVQLSECRGFFKLLTYVFLLKREYWFK